MIPLLSLLAASLAWPSCAEVFSIGSTGWTISAPLRLKTHKLGYADLRRFFPEITPPEECKLFSFHLDVRVDKDIIPAYGEKASLDHLQRALELSRKDKEFVSGETTALTHKTIPGARFRALMRKPTYGTTMEVFEVNGHDSTVGLKYVWNEPTQCRNAYAGIFSRFIDSLEPESSLRKEYSVRRATVDTEDGESTDDSSAVLRENGRAPIRPAGRGETEKSRAQMDQASGYLLSGNLFRAEAMLDELTGRYPAFVRSQVGRLALMRLMGRMDEYSNGITKTKEIDPDIEQSQVTFLCRPKANPKQKGSRIRPSVEDPCVSISNGLIREAFGNTKGALQSYNHAISLDPELWLAYAYRGILKIEQKDCPGGVSDLALAIRYNPLYRSHARHWLGQCPPAPAGDLPKPEPTPSNPFPEKTEPIPE